jgi:parvulin-like peptidyl-prolyl isomerase
MDVPDLVHAGNMRWLRSPALHMLAIGGLIYAVTLAFGGALFEEQPRITIAKYRLDISLKTFVEENGRLPNKDERRAILDALVDQEVLYTYARELGMDQQPVVKRRLAQIAQFVADNPHEMESEAERAAEAQELGLQDGDLVVRRILIDSARRLIRAVPLLQEPQPKMVEEFLRSNKKLFERPAKVRITHVSVNGFKWPDTERRARELLHRIRAESIDPETAPTLGDEPMVPSDLPLLTEQALSRKFGRDFAAAAMDSPVGRWVGPLESRFGHELVYVRERSEAHVPPLKEIYGKVKERLMQKLADQWLALRLQELRSAYNIVLPPGWS